MGTLLLQPQTNEGQRATLMPPLHWYSGGGGSNVATIAIVVVVCFSRHTDDSTFAVKEAVESSHLYKYRYINYIIMN